jgi:hypothetical protein
MMHPAFHQELARSRQAELLEEARRYHLGAQAKAANPQPSLFEQLVGRLPRRRLHRPVLGLAR